MAGNQGCYTSHMGEDIILIVISGKTQAWLSTYTYVVGMQVCHNDQPISYVAISENRERNARGNRVICIARSYQHAGLLPSIDNHVGNDLISLM